jgi:putative ABC transport system permease protein
MHRFAQELHLSLRRLGKTPGFSLAVVLLLALGIGATTAIFSLVEGILLRPLPYNDPGRLVLVGDHLGDNTGIGITAREIATYTRSTTAFSSLAGYINARYELSGGDVPVMVQATRFNAAMFPTLGVEPFLGRVFTREEEDAHAPVAVIGYGLWLTHFHRDPRVVGSAIVLNRRAYTIVGVMPRSFEFDGAQLWTPLSLTADELSDAAEGFWGYHQVGRLKPGVTEAQAAQDADRVAHQIMRDFPPSMSKLRIRGDAKTLRDNDVDDVRPLLRALFLAVIVVLLIACGNVAILMLVRAIRRRREAAIRLALGARSQVIVRESLAEGLVLSLAGGLLGLALAAAAIRIAVHWLPASMPRIDSVRMDPVVAGFALLLAIATGALCSLAPAFASLRANLLDSLGDSARTSTGSSSHAWLRSSLVAAEIAIALVLLTSSGALLRSYQKMLAVDPGFRPDQVLVADYQLPEENYSTNASIDTFNREVIDRLSARPGVTSAALSSLVPGSDAVAMAAYTIEGQRAEGWKLKFAQFGIVYGDYFHSLGIPLLEGRDFTPNDRTGAPPVIIVSQSMAQHSWPGQSALGKRMHVGNPRKAMPWATVIGIVADTKIGSRDEPSADQWYCPMRQPEILFKAAAPDKPTYQNWGSIILRSMLPPVQMVETLRSAVASIDPQLALNRVRPLSEAIAFAEAPRRFNTELIGVFALAALLLALTGIYAVVAFSVSLRAQEIAIRIALGARRGSIARLVLVSGARLSFFACGFGVLGSVAVSRLVRSLLFEVSPTDPWIYAACVVVMLLLTLGASAVPAARAASADPVEALRSV